MIAYKGFHADLTCTFGRGKHQYKEGVWMEEKQANCAKDGMHCAENPLDCLAYYDDWEKSAFYEVEMEGDVDEAGHNSHISATRMKLNRRLSKWEFTLAAVEYMCKYPKKQIQAMRHRWLYVENTEGIAPENGVVIVFGEHPRASGPEGSIIALVKTRGPEVEGYCIKQVGKGGCKPNTWYGV